MDDRATSLKSVDQARAAAPLTGIVRYLFAYDVAREMARRPIETLLGQRVVQFEAPVRRGPREQFFYSPQMVVLPGASPGQGGAARASEGGELSHLRRCIKLFPVGAISVAIDVPFAVDRLEDLADYHDLRLDGRAIEREALDLANQAVRELGGVLIGPVGTLRDEEAYTIFCVDAECLAARVGSAGAGGLFSAVGWLEANRAAVAGLLNDDDGRLLSDIEARETTANFLTYRHDDLVVMDWDAALVVAPAGGLEDLLHVMDLANVQLAELVAYDRFLDEALDRSYRDLARPRGRMSAAVRNLREVRLDLSRLSDELSNTTKFFGDWHLARIYQRLFNLFHLNDWQRVIDEKLHTVGDLYQLVRQDQNNRWMMALEIAIVVLFIVDLVILLIPLIK
jgi:hypothetical protein